VVADLAHEPAGFTAAMRPALIQISRWSWMRSV
jgi:hypothetical protein